MNKKLETEVQELTASEYEIMNIVWDSDHDITLREILVIAEERYQKVWKRQTVATFLSHIIEKGVAESYRVGRRFYYKPVIEKAVYQERETRNMLDFWYDGSCSQLFAALCKNEQISKEELKKVEDIINGMD